MKQLLKRSVGLVCALMLLVSMLGALPVFAISGGGSAGTGSIHAWGCDMSFYNTQGSSDFSLVNYSLMKADGCQYVILRVGYEGSASRKNTLDTSFVRLYNMAREAGMKVGVYFYALAKDYAGAVEDAQWCIDVFEQNNMYFEYPIYYDVEDPGSSDRVSHESLTSAQTTSLCLGWAETLANAGYFPGVYAGYYVLADLQSSYTNNYDTWIASVKSATTGAQFNPWSDKTSWRSTYGMWQYKWYNQGGTQVYNGAYWKDSYGYPLDCNVAFKDYPTIMANYGYNNMAAKQTVTFESNGGSAVDPMKVTAGKGFTPPADPYRQGFSFAGWFSNPELTDAYDFSAPVPEYDFTLYAKWTEAYWPAETNLMPKEASLGYRSYNDAGERIWAYWNAETGAVSMYNGVTDGGWPSAYMLYENSVDINNDSYLYFKKEGNAQFNIELTYMDDTGKLHSIKASEIVGLSTTDFPAGYVEEFVDVRGYLISQGHLPASGNLKFTQVDYYVIGAKDSAVFLYDAKFTPKFAVSDPYVSLYNSTPTQSGVSGNFTYNNGVVNMTSTSNDYSLTFNVNKSFSPTEMDALMLDINSTVPFDVYLNVTANTGDALMNVRTEFFNVFNFETCPETLPAGSWKINNMNLYGYYEWNGGVPAQSTVKSVTVKMYGQGTLTMSALQASRSYDIEYVTDSLYNSGSLTPSDNPDPTPSYTLGDVNGDGEITTTDARDILLFIVDQNDFSAAQLAAADFDGDGEVSTSDARDILLSIVS